MFVVVFAWTYLTMARSTPGSFTEPLDRVGALYFTVTVFATVGFGDITARTQAARVTVTAQMACDVIVVAAVVRLILEAAQGRFGTPSRARRFRAPSNPRARITGCRRRVFSVVQPPSDERTEIFREAVTMVLYVSVVEIAELAALPESHFSNGQVTGAVGGQLLAIVWGTAVGLAIAHWFAFRLAAPAFRGHRPTRLDTYIGLGQVGGGDVRRRGVEPSGAPVLRRTRAGDDR